MNKNFIKNLTERLLNWTGERWIISLSKNQENETNKINEFKKSKIAEELELAFPDAKLIEVKDND